MDSVEKRISEKLGVRRELSGYTRIENGDVLYKASDYRELCEQLWAALLASERSREQLEKCINEALLATRNEAMDWANNQSGLKEQYTPLAYGAYLRGLDIFAENLRKLTLPALPSEED